MRAYKRLGKEGFTLVELMIVVAIIGVLAALAIYGVRRYLATAKTSEAKNTIGAIARMADGAYQRETTASEMVAEGASSTTANNALCTTAGAVPASMAAIAGTKYQPSTVDGDVGGFETGDSTTGWKCLKFSMTQPIYYQYNYNANGGALGPAADPAAPDPGAAGFEAAAQGDINGDTTVFSLFTRAGIINPATKQLTLATQVFVHNEFE